MAEQEPKRNIIIESDDVSTRFPLQIDVVGYIAFARGLWMNYYCLRALVMLMQGLRGLNFDVAIKILEGKLTLHGEHPNIKVVPDNAPGLPSVDMMMGAQENMKMLAYIGEKALNPALNPAEMSRIFKSDDAMPQSQPQIKNTKI